MPQNSTFQLKTSKSTNSETNDAFSKPIVRRRFQATQAIQNTIPDDNLLPSVSEDSQSPLINVEVFSPPVSIPETSSDGNGDNNLSSSDSEPEVQSQSSTSSLNQKFEKTTNISKNSRLYEFDEFDEEEFVQPAQKKQKQDPEILTNGAKFIPKKEKKLVYNHKWTTNEDDNEDIETLTKTKIEERRPIYSRGSSSSIQSSSTSYSRNRVRNVKDSNEILESGEYDDFKHDVIYVLSTLNKKSSSNNVKCLSTISLAKKCVLPDFRQFIKSENMAGSLLKALADSPENELFALTASTVIYLLLRDFNCIRIDFSGLKLLSQLLRIDQLGESSEEKERIVNLVWEVFNNYSEKQERRGKNVAIDLKKENLTPSNLILEAMVFITTKCANDVAFKTELLNLGILQFIVAKIENTVNKLEQELSCDEEQLCVMILDRCFRTLEMCSMLHKKNQAFLISHRGSTLINSLAKFLSIIHAKVPNLEAEKAKRYMKCMAMLARVLINLSHENELCCSKLGQIPGFLHQCLMSFTYLAPKFAEDERKYDIYVMMSSLLVNLVERCNLNRKNLITTTIKLTLPNGDVEETGALEALAKLFVHHEANARTIDEDLDRDMMCEEGEEDEDGSDSDEEGVRKDGRLNRNKMENMDEQDVFNAIQQVMNKASAHMEDSIVASYIALLIGSLLQQNEESSEIVRNVLPDKRFTEMVSQLQRFLDFMKVAMEKKKDGTSGCRSIEKIIDVLERFD